MSSYENLSVNQDDVRAFNRLFGCKFRSSGAGPVWQWSQNRSYKQTLFNQVKGISSPYPPERSSLSPLDSAVQDNAFSALTIRSLSDVAREVREANLCASTVSVIEVEAAAKLAQAAWEYWKGAEAEKR